MKTFNIIFTIFCIILICISENLYSIENKIIIIDPLSTKSLFLNLYSNNIKIGYATGFIVNWNNNSYLITNWHVVTGRNPNNNKYLYPNNIIPNKISIWHNTKRLGNWLEYKEELYDKNNIPLWKEHPKGREIDIVALPLKNIDENIEIIYFALSLANTDMVPEIGMPIFIIGFPKGMSGGGKFPIWKTGHIASEPNIDYDNKPTFLIDATTKAGMSGSPVVLKLNSGYKTKSGNMIISSRFSILFLGVYSAQFPLAEIGLVWKPKVIKEIFESLAK